MFKFVRTLLRQQHVRTTAPAQDPRLNQFVDLLVNDYGETLRLLSKE